MATAETANAEKQAQANATRFVHDDQGRVLFYPNGLASGGYVVGTSDRERALREAGERHNAHSRRLAPILSVPFLLIFYWLVSIHPLFAFGLIAAVVPGAVLVSRLESCVVFGSLVEGLERVAPRKKRAVWLLLVALAGISAATWGTFELYNLRLAALPHDKGALAIFYGDISWGLVLTVFGGPITMLLLRQPTSQLTEPRRLAILVMFAVMAFGGLAWVISAFIQPKPVVTLTQGTLSCQWDVAWLEVSDISLKTNSGRFGRAWAQIALDPGSSADLRMSRAGRHGPLSCRIDGLNVGYEEVYQAIRDAWVARRTGSHVPASH